MCKGRGREAKLMGSVWQETGLLLRVRGEGRAGQGRAGKREGVNLGKQPKELVQLQQESRLRYTNQHVTNQKHGYP